jgi:broad specificity phosphatase PhoE
MTRLCLLLRHPESASNKMYTEMKGDGGDDNIEEADATLDKMNQLGDADITKHGAKQVEATANVLREAFGETSPAIWRSPMQRTEVLAEELGINCDYAPVVLTELVEYNPRTKSNAFAKDPTARHFHERVYDFCVGSLFAWGANTDDDDAKPSHTLIIVGHSLFLSTLISIVTLLSFQATLKKTEVLDQIGARSSVHNVLFHLPNCSLTTLQHSDANAWRILHVASTAHLSSDLVTGEHCEFR